MRGTQRTALYRSKENLQPIRKVKGKTPGNPIKYKAKDTVAVCYKETQ